MRGQGILLGELSRDFRRERGFEAADRRQLPFLGKIARSIGEFTAADRVALLDWAGERLGVAVCFEVIFPGETAQLVRVGATVLVTVTNDAWYGDTAAPEQHLRAARFRAAENRRWLVRAAVTSFFTIGLRSRS